MGMDYLALCVLRALCGEMVFTFAELGVGRDVLVRATFEGARYMAQSVNPTRAPEPDEK
jgi:hypothetical protein